MPLSLVLDCSLLGVFPELGSGITPPIQRQWLLQVGVKEGRGRSTQASRGRLEHGQCSQDRFLDWRRKNLEVRTAGWKGIFWVGAGREKTRACLSCLPRGRRAGLPRTPVHTDCFHSLGLEHVGRGSVDQFTSPAFLARHPGSGGWIWGSRTPWEELRPTKKGPHVQRQIIFSLAQARAVGEGVNSSSHPASPT